jgi:hypothetical protein
MSPLTKVTLTRLSTNIRAHLVCDADVLVSRTRGREVRAGSIKVVELNEECLKSVSNRVDMINPLGSARNPRQEFCRTSGQLLACLARVT